MNGMRIVAAAMVAVAAWSVVARAAEPPKVTVDENNAIRVDGKKFLPVAVWAQPEDTFTMWKDMGVNLFMTSGHPREGGTLANYLKAADEHQVYASIGYQWARKEGLLDVVMKHPRVLTIHHNDEPDKPHTVSDAKVGPGQGMKVNRTQPLFNVLDGNARSWTVIDPPQGVEFTLTLPKPVTVHKLAAAIVTGNYSSPRELEFVADGKSLLKVELNSSNGLQEFALPEAATFAALTVKVLSAHEGKAKFGALAEVQGLDAEGKNVLLSPTWLSGAETPEQVMADYQAVKKLDPERLVSLTIMARFMDEVKFQKLPIETYRQYPPATDLLMFDLYPVSIYKGNLHWNALGLEELRVLAGPKKALGIWLQASNAMNKNDPGMKPAQIRANSWLSLIHGATFIGYFPQTFVDGFKFHDISDERRAAVKAVNREMTALTDLVLSSPRSDLFKVTHEGGRVDVMQRTEGDQALLVLVNVIEKGAGEPVRVRIEPAAFKASAAPMLYGADRAVAAQGGAWSIELAPWETAVMVVDRAK